MATRENWGEILRKRRAAESMRKPSHSHHPYEWASIVGVTSPAYQMGRAILNKQAVHTGREWLRLMRAAQTWKWLWCQQTKITDRRYTYDHWSHRQDAVSERQTFMIIGHSSDLVPFRWQSSFWLSNCRKGKIFQSIQEGFRKKHLRVLSRGKWWKEEDK